MRSAGAPPFTVIGGYLGAGKTTLLNHLLTQAGGLRLAVLVNDFGSLNIDAALVRRHEGETIELANGCICCSAVDGLAAALAGLMQRIEGFDHVVIEASGVADPARIAQYGGMFGLPLDGIVVLADAEQAPAQAQNKYVGETVLRQFAQADLIVLNKSDLVDVDAREAVGAWLEGLAPGTPRIETEQSRVPLGLVLGAHDPELAKARPSERKPSWLGVAAAEHAPLYSSWTLERPEPLTRDEIERFAAGTGPDVFRAKGLLRLREDPSIRYVYQQVGRRWSLDPEAEGTESGDSQSRMVVIARSGSVRPDWP